MIYNIKKKYIISDNRGCIENHNTIEMILQVEINTKKKYF